MLLESSLDYFLAHFEPARLTFARELRGLTKKDLADKIQKTAHCLSQYESGNTLPSRQVFLAITTALNLPPAFFTKQAFQLPVSYLNHVHFRANLRVSQHERQKAYCYGRIVFSIFTWLEKHGVKFPAHNLPGYEQPATEKDMDNLAIQFRKDTGLGLGPIHDMAAFLENLGIRIIFLPPNTCKLDGFATWFNNTPCMMIDSDAPASRLQFNYAHELGHLIFDEHNSPQDILLERRANRFGGAFLMPRSTFEIDCPRQYKQAAFRALKFHWHVSVSAALLRARQLGIIGENTYKNACIARSKLGLKIREEEEFEPSLPTLLPQALELIADDIKLNDLAAAICVNCEELESILKVQKVKEEVLLKMRAKIKQARIIDFAISRKKLLQNTENE